MNYSIFIVKILKKPEQSFFNSEKNSIAVTEVLGKFYQIPDKENTICKLSIWGQLSYDIFQYYHKNDYLIVEGYLHKRHSVFEELNISTDIEISVFKIYPFALNNKQLDILKK